MINDCYRWNRMSSEFTYEIPNEVGFFNTLVKLLKHKDETEIIEILRNGKCTIQHGSQFSRNFGAGRWNAFFTTVYFYIPIENLDKITDEIKERLISICDNIMPVETGLDILSVKFSPSIEEPGNDNHSPSEKRNVTILRNFILNNIGKPHNIHKLTRIIETDSQDDLFRVLSLLNVKYERNFEELIFTSIQEGSYQNEIKKTGFIASSRLRKELSDEIVKFDKEYPIEKGVRVFIMMRFRDNEKIQTLEKSIRLTLQREGYQAILAKEKYFIQESVWRNVCVYMLGSDTGIAVLEKIEENFLNPNVLIELGFMLSQGKDCLVLKQKALNLPTDIIARIYSEFDGTTPETINSTIFSSIQEWTGKRV